MTGLIVYLDFILYPEIGDHHDNNKTLFEKDKENHDKTIH